MNKKRIYLAGGWFTPEMEEEHTRIYERIKHEFNVFNPKLEGIVTRDATTTFTTSILLGNIEGIKNADIILVIYDGKDAGTIWEAGFAYANKKPIVYYAEKLNGKKFNLMLAKTGNYASNEKDLLEILRDDASYQFKNVYDFLGDIE